MQYKYLVWILLAYGLFDGLVCSLYGVEIIYFVRVFGCLCCIYKRDA